MRIERIILRQVGPFENETIDFEKGTDPSRADVYLFTGPNGSGKSTVLYAMAGILTFGHRVLGTNLGALRLRSEESFAAIESAGCCSAMAWSTSDRQVNRKLLDLFDGNKFQCTRSISFPPTSYYASLGEHPLHDYALRASQFRVVTARNVDHRFSWAAFAYAGMRSVSKVDIKAPVEPEFSPFEHCLSFTKTADTQRLAQWIANQDFKRLKAKYAGRDARVRELEQSIRDIERIVTEIIGDNFEFDTSGEDSNVRARLNGAVIPLELLPDGLKAIISWVADLLMRLDRIPWVNDTPPMQRSFLLLLDEVDVHLHPSWQRKVLPIVQRMFPNAQIIASTHSPFVVASAEDARVISLAVQHGVSRVESVAPSQSGASYGSVLRSIFGIESEFDIETERKFAEFHQAKDKVLSGATTDLTTVRELANALTQRSEEVNELVAIELRQLDRQLAQRGRK